MEINARFAIKKGEELTTSYIQPTQATIARRQFLFHTWHFWCSCLRCRDPTEGGANLAGEEMWEAVDCLTILPVQD